MFPSKKITALFHGAGWVLFLGIPLLFINHGRPLNQALPIIFTEAFWLFGGLFILFFYLNYSYLIPKYYFRSQYLVYGAAFCLGLLLVLWQQPFERLVSQNRVQNWPQESHPEFPHVPFRMPPPGSPPPGPAFDIVSVVLYVMIWALGLALRITQDWQLVERRAMQAEAEKAQAELMSLKAQINPHFLFNTLNTIYTMAQLNHPACAESIMKLSNIMRYVSDEVIDDRVALEEEIACIRQYIDLQQLRLNRKTTVEFGATLTHPDAPIPPLLLLTLVENIFKHGVSSHEASTIEIRVATDGGRVKFYSRNKKFSSGNPGSRDGTGLKNVRKRLLHSYPDRHSLTIDATGEFFTVTLELTYENT